MGFRELLRKYQSYDPVTGSFSQPRNDRQYSTFLGVERNLISRYYSGEIANSYTLLAQFLLHFPEAAAAVARAIAVDVADPADVEVAV